MEIRKLGHRILFEGPDHLYIGSSAVGLSRVFSSSHVQVKQALETCTQLEVIPCANLEEARFLEARLITTHKPKFNLSPPAHKYMHNHSHYVDEVYIFDYSQDK